jgi:hypothetical protein
MISALGPGDIRQVVTVECVDVVSTELAMAMSSCRANLRMNVIVTSKLPVTKKGHMLRVLKKFVAVDVALALSVCDDKITTILVD